MYTKVAILTLLMLLGIIPGCAPLKVNTCTQVPQIVDKVDALAPYAGKPVCIGVGVEVSMPTQ